MILACLLAIAQLPEGSLERDLYRAQMFAAESALRLGEPAVARAWLDETDPRQRGFEWRVHAAALDESLRQIAIPDGYVYALDVSPDGTMLACGLSTGRIELRRASDGELLATFDGHKESLSHLRFDATGARIVSSSFDRTVKVWDVAKRSLLVDFRGHGFPVGGAAFSPDGTLVASCSYERPPGTVVGTLHVWNAADGTIVRTMQGGRKPLIGLAFSPDGRHIAAGSWDFCVFVWPLEGGEPTKCAMPDEGLYNAVDDVAWSPDSRLVVGGSKDETARVWNAANGALVATLRAHTDAVGATAFSDDGTLLATGSADGSVCVWETTDWKLVGQAKGHADDVEDVAFSPDSRTVFSSSLDTSVRAFDATCRWYGGPRVSTDAAVYVACLSPDDELIASASFDGRIQLWSASTLDLLATRQAHPANKSCHALAWTHDGRRLVSGSWEPIVRVWDSRTLKELAKFEQPDGTQDLAVAPDDRYVITACGKKVIVWELATCSKAREFTGHTSTVLSVAFGPDARTCVSTGRDGKALVWWVDTGEIVCSIEALDADVAAAAFTADGLAVVVAGRSGGVSLHRVPDGTLVRTLARSRHGLNHIAVSPDGSRVVLASDVAACVDLAHDRIVGGLRPHGSKPYNLDFDSTGRRLVSCSTDKTIALTDARPLRELIPLRQARLVARARAQQELDATLAGGRSLDLVIADLDAARARGADRDDCAARLEAILLRVPSDRP